MKRLVVALCALLAFSACREEVTSDSYPAEMKRWRADREARLKKEDGWLTLAGLFWLEPGENTFGSAKPNRIAMPANAPAKCGTLTLREGQVFFDPDPSAGMTINGQPAAAGVELLPDTDEKGPTRVSFGVMHFIVIKRGEKFGIRVRDPESPARVAFRGLDYYPADARWRVNARLERYGPPKKVPITNVIGMTSDETSPGALVFELEGTTYRLDPIMESGSDELFVIFKDATSRDTTYPAGRYLYAAMPGAGGRVILDFNKAYNPPCAFTPFATCPLPPRQNRIAARVEAGEKNYGH
ncbi:MAG: DUF1684 domain-containing protein [Thermoanaerobaculia bacterium]|nr:DUF1684 domain-containing protein [Thermoanaerobaculia bacterium]